MVPVDIYDEFVKEAVKLANNRKVGDPLQSGCEQGPIVSKVQFDKVMNYIKSGQEEGAIVHTGRSLTARARRPLIDPAAIF